MLLFQKRFHAGLTSGEVTLTFRRWPRSRVKAGGRYRCHPIGVLEVDGFEVQSQWSTLVNPGVAVPSEIQALNGITREMLVEAPRFADLAEECHGHRLGDKVFGHLGHGVDRQHRQIGDVGEDVNDGDDQGAQEQGLR